MVAVARGAIILPERHARSGVELEAREASSVELREREGRRGPEHRGVIRTQPGGRDEDLEAFLHAVIAKFESRIEGEPWRAEESSEATWSGLFRGIVGFEMEVQAWRPTFKLSQKKSEAERARIADGQTAAGRPALAAMMGMPGV